MRDDEGRTSERERVAAQQRREWNQALEAQEEARRNQWKRVLEAQEEQRKNTKRKRAPSAKRSRVSREVLGDARASASNPGSVEAFERAAIGSMLWHRPRPHELTEIPAEFRDARHYVASFEPVLMEETREEIRSAWLESLSERRQYPLRLVATPDALGNTGWYKAMLQCDDRRDAEAIRSLCQEHSVAVLCERRIDDSDPWPRAVDGLELPLAVAAFVEKVTTQEGLVEVKFFIPPEAHVALNPAAPGFRPWHQSLRRRERAVLEAFEGVRRPVTDATGRRLPPGAETAELSEDGECKAPPPRRAEGRTWFLAPAGKLSSASQTYEALHHFRALHAPMRAAMLKPPKEGMPRVLGCPPPPLAEEIEAHPHFVNFLNEQFNEPQLAAIKWSSAHTLRSFDLDAAADDRDDGEGVAAATRSEPFPFTLVQGPPGTGKTHTVWGILNILHLVLYQRYYQHLHRAIARGAARITGDVGHMHAVEHLAWLETAAEPEVDGIESDTVTDLYDNLKIQAGVERGQNYGVSKPRILVCAPSNAAIDNLLERVMYRGFRSLEEGRTYNPNIIRVGAQDGVVADKVRNVYAGNMVEGLMRMSPQEWNDAYIKQDKFVKDAARYIAHLEKEHISAAAVTIGAEGGAHEDPVAKAVANDRRVSKMLQLADDRNKGVADMARLAYLLTYLGKGGGGKSARANHFDQLRVRRALEASFVDEAEIVFTTLTSSSRRVFRQLTHGFDTVLIDEAAQANEVGRTCVDDFSRFVLGHHQFSFFLPRQEEPTGVSHFHMFCTRASSSRLYTTVATLIPFLHGARRCVLVGDPQQLPATVLSGAAQNVSFQRSLFERFTTLGAQALLLSVQYRMHPEIRAFPSAVFYDGRLMDSESVRSNPPESYHAVFPLRPYMLFDVSGGMQQRSGAGSLSNPVEAVTVVCLFKQLQAVLEARGESVVNRVSIITPYRQQRTVIVKAFAALCGEETFASDLLSDIV